MCLSHKSNKTCFICLERDKKINEHVETSLYETAKMLLFLFSIFRLNKNSNICVIEYR